MIPKALREIVWETLQRLRIVKKNDIIEPADHNLLVNAVDKLFYMGCIDYQEYSVIGGLLLEGYEPGATYKDTVTAKGTLQITDSIAVPVGFEISIPVVFGGWYEIVELSEGYVLYTALPLIEKLSVEFMSQYGDTLIQWELDLSKYSEMYINRIVSSDFKFGEAYQVRIGVPQISVTPNNVFCVYLSPEVPFGVGYWGTDSIIPNEWASWGVPLTMMPLWYHESFIGGSTMRKYSAVVPEYDISWIDEYTTSTGTAYVGRVWTGDLVRIPSVCNIPSVDVLSAQYEVGNLETIAQTDKYNLAGISVSAEVSCTPILEVEYSVQKGAVVDLIVPLWMRVYRYNPPSNLNIPWYYEV